MRSARTDRGNAPVRTRRTWTLSWRAGRRSPRLGTRRPNRFAGKAIIQYHRLFDYFARRAGNEDRRRAGAETRHPAYQPAPGRADRGERCGHGLHGGGRPVPREEVARGFGQEAVGSLGRVAPRRGSGCGCQGHLQPVRHLAGERAASDRHPASAHSFSRSCSLASTRTTDCTSSSAASSSPISELGRWRPLAPPSPSWLSTASTCTRCRSPSRSRAHS
jgi:hypothetical protein